MDSFEWNKVFGAVLAALFIVLGLNFLSEGLFSSHAPEKPGFEIAGGEVKSEGGEKKKAGAEPINALLASADLAKGEKVAKKCAACHVFNEGGKNKVGPGLYDIVNRTIASADGFGYSGALKALGGEGKVWDYEALNAFLYKPKDYAKGTSMGFAGVKKTEDRAALVAYLRSLSSSPAELPAE